MLRNRHDVKPFKMAIRPGDTVVVIAGKDRGKRGQVLRTLPDRGQIVVQGVNLRKKHVKAGQSAAGTAALQGGIVDFEAPLSYSNVMIVCPNCGEPTRVKRVVLEGGRKAIECRKCGQPFEHLRRGEEQ